MASKQENINKGVNILLGVGGAWLGYKIVLQPIFKAVGLQKSDTVLQNEAAQLAESAWNPQFYKNAPAGSILINSQAVKEIAQNIYDSLNWYGDDFDTILAQLRKLRTKAQVSQLADYFANVYDNDLYSYLREGDSSFPGSGLSNEHLKTLNDLVATYPNYK